MQRSHKFAKKKNSRRRWPHTECTTPGRSWFKIVGGGAALQLQPDDDEWQFCSSAWIWFFLLGETRTSELRRESNRRKIFTTSPSSNVIYRNAQKSPKFFTILAMDAHTTPQMPNCLPRVFSSYIWWRSRRRSCGVTLVSTKNTSTATVFSYFEFRVDFHEKFAFLPVVRVSNSDIHNSAVYIPLRSEPIYVSLHIPYYREKTARALKSEPGLSDNNDEPQLTQGDCTELNWTAAWTYSKDFGIVKLSINQCKSFSGSVIQAFLNRIDDLIVIENPRQV